MLMDILLCLLDVKVVILIHLFFQKKYIYAQIALKLVAMLFALSQRRIFHFIF